jgi:hypothetical protein
MVPPWLLDAAGFLALLFLNGLVIPLLIENYPEFFKSNPRALPLALGVTLLCLFPFVWHHSPKFFRLIDSRIGVTSLSMAWFIVILMGCAAGGLISGGGYWLFLKHTAHMLAVGKPENGKPNDGEPKKDGTKIVSPQNPESSGTVPPSRPKQPQKPSEGLEFHEVTPEKVGIPQIFEIDFGTNLTHTPKERLKKKIPFSQLTGFSWPGELPLSIHFDRTGTLLIDASIYDQFGKLSAKVVENNFAIAVPHWDRNWDNEAFEIVDENQIPYLQIQRPEPNVLKFRGVFRDSKGDTFVSTDKRTMLNPTTDVARPERLFVYPSKQHLHERRSTPQKAP